jgi:uncharacterized protein
MSIHHNDKFQQGLKQFNSRLFFEAHESWEEIWLHAPEPEKTFLQGLIQVSAAFHHYCRRNPKGAHSLLSAGLAKLARFPANHRGLDLEDLRAIAKRWEKALSAGEDPGEDALPQISRVPAHRTTRKRKVH